jgi:tRNA pseudouridine38-40 synthase
MEDGAKIIMQHTDFASFSRSHTQVKTTICHITEARWEQNGHRLVFTITANRFLRNMVRAVVGTLLEIGKGRRTAASLPAMLETKTRSNAGMSAPAHGLYLVEVKYPDWVFSLAVGE